MMMDLLVVYRCLKRYQIIFKRKCWAMEQSIWQHSSECYALCSSKSWRFFIELKDTESSRLHLKIKIQYTRSNVNWFKTNYLRVLKIIAREQMTLTCHCGHANFTGPCPEYLYLPAVQHKFLFFIRNLRGP